MPTPYRIHQDIRARIRRDIRPFADPGSEVLSDSDQLYWEKDGEEHFARLNEAPGDLFPRVTINGVDMAYRDFLASAYMADLQRLAEFIPKSLDHPDDYVDTRASLSGDQPGDNADLLVARLSTEELPYGSTRIVLVRGDAGAGKTMALRKMTIDRAADYRNASSSRLFFYVDVQGRSLSRLDDAMARDLQDLRSRFSYSAVPPLVRNGLLVPVIDGFDELLGSGGYDEAFSSLAAFIAQLDGRGSVVASARSAFFDYNSFRSNAQRFAHDGQLNYEIDEVTLQPWNDEDADRFIAKATDDPTVVTRFNSLRDGMPEAELHLLRKPFYVAQVAKLLKRGDRIASDETILHALVDRFIRREHDKLRDRDGAPLLSLEGHRMLLVRLSEEMWWLETRYLDVDTVRTWAELVLEELDVPEDNARQVRTRVATNPFLTTRGSKRGELRFEHEVFYGFFLAERLTHFIDNRSPELRRFLNRSILDDNVLEHAIARYSSDVGSSSRAASAVCSVLQRGVTDGVARQNGGRLVARLIRACGGLESGRTLRTLYFDQEDFGAATLRDPVFVGCDFVGVDFTGTQMHSPRFAECTFQEPRVAMERTRFADASSDLAKIVKGIVVTKNGIDEPYYAPRDIARILVKLGMESTGQSAAEPTLTSQQVERKMVLERFLVQMERRFYVATETLERLSVARESEWPEVRRLLEDHQLLTEVQKRMSGRPKPLIRLSVPPRVIRQGEDATSVADGRVSRFWEDLLG
ncbi:MAG: NACHT domain-containing protein [Gemmatimonadetes bacterium]|nr:NACHT domain-containing protein [Gemmatimonadota bacterium]MYB97073.1 NACHT domain-containing protein [Gemmatimonadota bacterium]MYI45460.1 NACHT domain-containing protein [Gemmatimonadota bacterium]